MTLVKLSLESKGIYVNYKPTAVKQFLEEFKGIDDKEVVVELHELWNSWHQENSEYDDAKVLTSRLMHVANQIDKTIK